MPRTVQNKTQGATLPPSSPIQCEVQEERFFPPVAFGGYRHIPVEYGYGKCSLCSCSEFFGSGSTCDRAGCGHHYDDHW